VAGTQPFRLRSPNFVCQVLHRGSRAQGQRQPVSGKPPVALVTYELTDTIKADLGPGIRVG
jgi:hypothetical protein